MIRVPGTRQDSVILDAPIAVTAIGAIKKCRWFILSAT